MWMAQETPIVRTFRDRSFVRALLILILPHTVLETLR